MHPYTGNISPNPASSGESNSSVSTSRPRFPSTVVLEHLNPRRGAAISSSEGTGPTCIETSPLSVEQYSPVDTGNHYNKQRQKQHVSNGSHHKAAVISTKKKGRQKVSHQHESTHCHNSNVKHIKPIKQGTNKQNETYIWRMDPSMSLSDFTLTIIGIDDKNAIRKYLSDKKKKQEKKQSKRRDIWMVEGLYLDMSQSEDDDDCRNDDDDKDHGSGQEHRSAAHVHSTISGTKTSNYPVVENYYLHKVNLAVGLKSCDYFARLFQKKDTSNKNNNHSIEIPLSCLPAIPAMLDYLYHPDTTTPVYATTATAIPLRYLGTLFGNRPLFNSATCFLHMDLRPETAIEYLQHAELYQQKKLAGVCIRICAESFDQLKITWFASLAPHLMTRILHSKYFTRSINSLAVCSKIASYCRCQLHKIDREMLLSLTSEKVMPSVCPEEAIFFIQMMIRLGMDADDHNQKRLYEKCIDAAPMVVQGVIDSLCQGNAGGVDNPGGYRRKASRQTKNACVDYSRLPPQIKVDLLEYALAKQQKSDDSTDKCRNI